MFGSTFSSPPRGLGLAARTAPASMRYSNPIISSAKVVGVNDAARLAKWMNKALSTASRTKGSSISAGSAESSHTDASLTRNNSGQEHGAVAAILAQKPGDVIHARNPVASGHHEHLKGGVRLRSTRPVPGMGQRH